MRIIANALAGLILLVTLTCSILLADEINTVALWDFGLRDMVTLLSVGPLATLAILILDRRGRYQRIPTQTFLWLNGAGLLLLVVLVLQTVNNTNGFWLEKTLFERHFCNCLQRYHLFPPYVGTIGAYLSVVGYLTYRKLGWHWGMNPLTIFSRFIGFMPVVGFYGLVIWHQWIPKPYFIGVLH